MSLKTLGLLTEVQVGLFGEAAPVQVVTAEL